MTTTANRRFPDEGTPADFKRAVLDNFRVEECPACNNVYLAFGPRGFCGRPRCPRCEDIVAEIWRSIAKPLIEGNIPEIKFGQS